MKDLLVLAEQIMRLKIGIDELLAFHSAVYEKADMEKLPLDEGAYRIAEDIRYYRQLGWVKQESEQGHSTDLRVQRVYGK